MVVKEDFVSSGKFAFGWVFGFFFFFPTENVFMHYFSNENFI